MSFSKKLLSWYQINGRSLPWRETKDPYVIWLSEIILQQTRVEQGTPYFMRFLSRFPDIQSFAEADIEEVNRLWQGLGYYSRARNMHKAANHIMHHFDGIFPLAYSHLLTLPGVGEYTAAAISSFAANEKRAVVDGNVYRVLSRFFGIDLPINSTQGKKYFQSLADDLIDGRQPGAYNQAIMDFGAIQCKPRQPLCSSCIFSDECTAFLEGRIDQLPVKEKKKKSRDRYFHYIIAQNEGEIMVSKRPHGDIWTELYEFPLIEADKALTAEQLLQTQDYQTYFGNQLPILISSQTKHVLTHQNIYAQFFKLPLDAKIYQKKSHWNYIISENLDKLAKHKLIFSFLERSGLTD